MEKIDLTQIKSLYPDIEEKNYITKKLDNGLELLVCNYLPMAEKSAILADTVIRAFDAKTGGLNPLRVEVYFMLNIAKYYSNIEIDFIDEPDALACYDLLERTGLFNLIALTIPKKEYDYLKLCLKEVCEDFRDFNRSLLGMLTQMSDSNQQMDAELTNLINKVRSQEGLELLSAINELEKNDKVVTLS